MNILSRPKCADQDLIFRKVRQYAKFHLRIVRRDQHIPLFGNESAPDQASQIGPDRDVLQIGIRARQPSSGRARLVERSMDSSGLRMNQRGKSIHISGFKFGNLPVFENQFGNLIGLRKFFEDRLIGAVSSGFARFFHCRQVELLEKNLSQAAWVN